MSSSAAPAPLRVLASDDDALGARLIDLFLQRLGHKATVVQGGKAAEEAACTTEFDVMLLDIEMPDQDGWTTLRRVREQGKTTPAIALTGHAAPEDRARCLAAGFAGYLSKPLRLPDLQAELQRVLQTPPPADDAFDAARLARELDVDTDTVALLVQAFMNSGVSDAADLGAAVASLHFDEVQHRAHRLRGSLGSLSQHELAAQAATIEQRCREGRTDLALDAAPAFLKAFEQFESAARRWLAER